MAVSDSTIETSIVDYVNDARGRNELPTRHNAIRHITGQLDILPSAVAKVITKMLEAGTLKHVTNDQLKLPERVDTPAAEPAAAPAPAAPLVGRARRRGDRLPSPDGEARERYTSPQTASAVFTTRSSFRR